MSSSNSDGSPRPDYLEETEENDGPGILDEAFYSDSESSRLLLQARRLQAKKRVYRPPIYENDEIPIIPVKQMPDVAIHPPIGTEIPRFPVERFLERYPTRDAAANHLAPIALELGFGLATGKNNKYKSGRLAYRLDCHWGGTRGRGENAAAYKNENRCPFYISLVNDGRDNWFTASASDIEHSHKALDPVGNPPMTATYLEMNHDSIATQIDLGQTLNDVRARFAMYRVPHEYHQAWRFYDELRQIAKRFSTRLPVESALKAIEKAGDIAVPWISRYTGRLEGILYSNAKARGLTQKFHKVFMADITFKTNKYNLPMMHIVGKTNANTVFTSAIILLPNQAESTQVEALQAWKEHVLLSQMPGLFITDREAATVNAVRRVFPGVRSHRCRWHILENIIENCANAGTLNGKTDPRFREFFDDWKKEVLHNPNAEDIPAAHERLRAKWRTQTLSGYNRCLYYTIEELGPVLPFFIDSHINQWPHLDNHATSPAEGTHAKLKKWFLQQKPHLAQLIEHVRSHISIQYANWATWMSKQRQDSGKPMQKLHPELRQFEFQITRHALNRLDTTFQALKKDRDGRWTVSRPCSGYQRTVLLLPCAHDIVEALNNGSWPLYQFDPYWYVFSTEEMEAVMERAAAQDTRLARNARERLPANELPPVVLEPLVRRVKRPSYANERDADRFNPRDEDATMRFKTAAEMADISARVERGDVTVLELEKKAREADLAALEARKKPKKARTTATKSIRTCSACKQPGHNRTSCHQAKLADKVFREVTQNPDKYKEIIDLTIDS